MSSPFKSSCIYCSDEVSVCSFLGYRSRIPVDKSLARSSSCSSEDSGTENASSKRAYPSQRSRQSKKPKSTLKCSTFKKPAKCQKQRPSPAIIKSLQQKRKLNKELERCSPEPLFKAVILREMIRLGRQPKSTFGKAAKSARSSRKCGPKRSCKAENLSENPADLMEMLFGTQENAIENVVEFESFNSLISNEVPRTPSFEHEVQVHNQDYPQELEKLGSANTEFELSLMDLDETKDVDDQVDEESTGTAPHYALEESDSASDNNSNEIKSTMSSQHFYISNDINQ